LAEPNMLLRVPSLELKHELKALTSHKYDLNSREATLAAEQKGVEETRTGVLACELTTDIKDMQLNSR
jgi:hypothetical protein